MDPRVVTEGDALALAARLGIEGVAARELHGGFSNESWRVDDARGERYVARRYGRLHVTRRALFFEHALMRYAAERMREVRAPLADARGETILEDAGAFAAVTPYVEGATGLRGADAMRRAAELLGRFHLNTRGFRAARPRVARALGVLPWVRHRLLGFANDPLLARALPWDRVLTAIASATTRFAPLATRVPLANAHGDVHPDNVVSEPEGRVAGLIDFDFAHETERCYDVATAIDNYARESDDASLDFASIEAFVAAYDAVAPLAFEERAALPAMAIRRNAVLVWYVVTRHGMRARGDVGNAARYVARASEWERLAREWEARRAAS